MSAPRIRPFVTIFVAALLAGTMVLVNCSRRKAGDNSEKEGAARSQPKPTEDTAATAAKAFVAEVDTGLRELWIKASRIQWAKDTNITEETEAAAVAVTAELMAYRTKKSLEAKKFKDYKGDFDVARQLQLLRLGVRLPAPDDEAKRKELAELSTEMKSIYSKGKVCDNTSDKESCRDLGQLSQVMAESRDYDALRKAWVGWRTVSVPLRDKYRRFVELANEGARNIGFADVGVLWRSGYDMEPEAFEREYERLWGQVQPLYEALHCHVRAKLGEKYGIDKVPADGLIPAHLFGNMWAQDWAHLYPLLEPHPGASSIDVSEALKRDYDPIKMVKLGEAFFSSLGFAPLPATFWERSLFVKPDDREVVCHASAWNVDLKDDLRLKMCIRVNHEDLVVIHHELGHNYYQRSSNIQPTLYQRGAHDGFHEAIGDAIVLSITPEYLEKVGLIDEVSVSDESLINQQMLVALDRIAFLPFGKLIDEWRWDVFSGRTPPEKYNAAWWQLRGLYQGIAPPVPRSESDFDPGAKYHIPANTPYTRYFLAHILQFQFHKAMCEAAGHEGSLHTCSVYGSKKAGDKLRAMLAMGASRPWPEALEKLTGSRTMDAAALIEYFEPLMGYLEKQNQGRSCGW